MTCCELLNKKCGVILTARRHDVMAEESFGRRRRLNTLNVTTWEGVR